MSFRQVTIPETDIDQLGHHDYISVDTRSLERLLVNGWRIIYTYKTKKHYQRGVTFILWGDTTDDA